MSAQRPGEPPQNIAAAVADVSERATALVREEIELAKAELKQDLKSEVAMAKGQKRSNREIRILVSFLAL